MSRNWEAAYANWAMPPGLTEEQRIENAISAVRKAIAADATLRAATKVYLQGSYRNNVNVRQDSDVDIGVLYTGNSFGVVYPDGVDDARAGNGPATYSPRMFKDDVERALVAHFGRAAVHRGDKAFDIHENTYRVDADVVPTFRHRRYRADGTYICGVELYPDAGGRIINWPERLEEDPHWPDQHYENGVAKNKSTGRRYKAVVRILKALRNEMDEAGIQVAHAISGFTVECLVWNVPGSVLMGENWSATVQSTLAFLWRQLRNDSACEEWGEVSELKYLFKGSPGKREQAYAFIDAAWSRVGVTAVERVS